MNWVSQGNSYHPPGASQSSLCNPTMPCRVGVSPPTGKLSLHCRPQPPGHGTLSCVPVLVSRETQCLHSPAGWAWAASPWTQRERDGNYLFKVCCGAQHPGPSDQGEAVCSLEPHIPGAETQGEEDIQEHEPPSPPSQSQLSQLHVSECLPTHRCKQSPRPPPVPTPAPPGWDSQKPGRATVQSEQRPREERGLSGLGAELSSQPDPQAPSLPAPLHRTHGLGPQGDFKTPQTMPRGGGREQPQWVRSHLLRSPFCKPWPGASEPCWRLLKH